MIGSITKNAIRILARTTGAGSKPFIIYYLLLIISLWLKQQC